MSTARLINRERAAVGAVARAGADPAWLAPLSGHWIDAACAHLASQAALVRVTVMSRRGSAPREPGASMLVDGQSTRGTIGGGHLEWHAIQAARRLLIARGSAPVHIEDLVLGPQLGQCCGGRVELWLERLTRRDLGGLQRASRQARADGASSLETRFAAGGVTRRVRTAVEGAAVTVRREGSSLTLVEPLREPRAPLWIFGAGHVGQALVRVLAGLALFDIHWIDSRPELLPAGAPDGVSMRTCPAPATLIREAQPFTSFVVLTHDHALDFELCRTVLERGDSAWLGLIGSASKAARFRSRLKRAGIEAERLGQLTCPIGVPGIASKLPAVIAIAIAAQLLQRVGAAGSSGAVGLAGSERAAGCEDAAVGCGACGALRHPAP
jgi:xanthine dehydrogenase accessory factor